MQSIITFLGWLTFIFCVLPVLVMMVIGLGLSLHATLEEYLAVRKQRKEQRKATASRTSDSISENAELVALEAKDGHAVLAVILLMVIGAIATAIIVP